MIDSLFTGDRLGHSADIAGAVRCLANAVPEVQWLHAALVCVWAAAWGMQPTLQILHVRDVTLFEPVPNLGWLHPPSCA